jgi:stage III sporulation protein AE
MAALSLLLEHLTGGALLSLLRVMLGFLLVSAVGEVRTDGVMATLRSIYVTVLGAFCALTSAALALGNILGAASDTLSLRSLRFAVGQMVPVVGGAVSGGLGTAMASVGLVRSTAGIGVAAAILLPLIPVLSGLLLSRLALSLLATLGALFGLATPVRLLRGFRSLLDLCLAAAAFSAMLFVFIAALFAACRPAVL